MTSQKSWRFWWNNYPSHHEHVVEVADQLGNFVKEWQFLGDALEETGARIAGFDPGYLEWHGVVDGYLVLYSWSQGEEDIEWWHPLDTGIMAADLLLKHDVGGMVRITKVHTGGGDEGETSLVDGSRVSKSNARIEIVGT